MSDWIKDGRFTVRIEFLSDWHIGAGAGIPGDIDRLIVRDPDGLPYVPATSLTGVWRAACEQLAFGLDAGTDQGPWSKLVQGLFGDQPNTQRRAATRAPRPARLQVRAGRLPESVRRAFAAADRRYRTALGFTKPGVAVDPRTGRARPDHLRFVEMARAGLVLKAEVTLDEAALVPAVEAARALLLGGLALVEAIGGQRQRGAGRCTLTVPDAPSRAEVAKQLDQPTPPPALETVPPADVPPADPPVPGPLAAADDWVDYHYELVLRTPVVVAAETVGNVIASRDWVPGTYWLPAITRCLSCLVPWVRAAIVAGELQAHPWTLAVGGAAGRPVPFCWEALKAGQVAESPGEAGDEPRPNTQFRNQRTETNSNAANSNELIWKQCRGGWLGPTLPGQVPVQDNISFTMTTHNVIDDTRLQTDADFGGLFSMQAIAAGTRFRGRLRLRRALADALARVDPHWPARLAGRITLGTSRKDEYGLGEITWLQDAPTAPNSPPSGTAPATTPLVIWALSPLLLRNDRLRHEPTPAALAKAVQEALAKAGAKVGVTPGRAWVRTVRLESWQSSWGQPRPSLIGLAAGSVVELSIDHEVTAAQLSAVERAGLGDRRGEGYGQVRFNDPLVCGALLTLQSAGSPEAPQAPAEPTPLRPEDAPRRVAEAVERAVWMAELDHRAAVVVAQDNWLRDKLGWTVKDSDSRPPMSQLGALRAALGHGQPEGPDNDLAERAAGWFKALDKAPARADKWHRAKGPTKDLLTDPSLLWQWLSEDPVAPPDGEPAWPPGLVREPGAIQQALWPAAVRTLLDACFKEHRSRLDQDHSAETDSDQQDRTPAAEGGD